MAIDFTPQFHTRLSRNDERGLWVALPRPETLIRFKAAYYRSWQQEERQRLQSAGEEVLTLPISH